MINLNFKRVANATAAAVLLFIVFLPVGENMEGAAVAQICALYRVPFLEVRGISNLVENRDKRKWIIKPASENCQKAVLELLTSRP